MAREHSDRPQAVPMCEKLAARDREVGAVMEFLNFLEVCELHICNRLSPDLPGFDETFVPMTKKHIDLAYAFFGIDAKKLEEERRALLEWERRRLSSDGRL